MSDVIATDLSGFDGPAIVADLNRLLPGGCAKEEIVRC